MSADPLISQTLGNYEILSRIGKGGMATVYRARQRNMARDVAIKVMSADLVENPQFVARFEREAQVIANLQHPRILPVHDFGHEGETFYLVMRLIEGESLYQRLQRGALPLATAGKFLDQMAEALDYAHSQGVIHRDLKPNNILIDEWDNLYLMDFGLAKMLAESQSLTQTGTVLGTPAYMSPEQWRGEPVDARTDVYSLGVILYEMVVGHTPFESDTPFTLMYKHLNDAPPPPRETLPDLPEEIERVILKALAKSKEDRYQSAGQLANEFGNLVRVAGSLSVKRVVPPSIPVLAPEPAERAQQAAPLQEPVKADSVPLPEGMVLPPPPSIPVPPPPGSPSYGAPMPPGRREKKSDPTLHLPESVPPGVRDFMERMASSPALHQALDAVDQSLDMAFEKAAEALSGPSSSAQLPAKRGVPEAAAAFDVLRGLMGPDEALVGVVDVRGTPRWQMWKRLLVGGLALNLVSGITSIGFLGAVGWLMWLFLIIETLRTWKGKIGRYYLGFSVDRVILLSHDDDGRPDARGMYAADWSVIERLRLTTRYALVDMPSGTADEVIHFGGVVLANGDGGLDNQPTWLPQSDIGALIAERGFESRNL